MLFKVLQAATPAADVFSADTLVAKGSHLVETIKTTPTDELVASSASAVAKFGLKVLLAVAIYIIGAWLIRKTKKIIAKAFDKRKSDKTLASFIQSLVTATLWVVLILAMVGTLGINTTSIAALLAAAVALPLAGCFWLPGPDDIADQADEVAGQAQELADTLSDVDWGKVSRLVVRDAQTGEVIREVTGEKQYKNYELAHHMLEEEA